MIDHAKYSVSATSVIEQLKMCEIDHIVTVPDMLQIALHTELDSGKHGITQFNCTTEDQAIEVASGLWAGGAKAAIIVQNQGFYAGLNSLRALGLDSKIPLMFIIGQFGREWSNLGQDPRQSSRRMVYMLEPLMELLDIPYWRVEKPEDVGHISLAWKTSRHRSGPTALILGHFVAFN